MVLYIDSVAFFPEKEHKFVKYHDMCPLVELMREAFDHKVKQRRYDEKSALFRAYVEMIRYHQGEDNLVIHLGADRFYDALKRSILKTRDYFRSLIMGAGPFSSRFSALDSFGPVQVALKPIRLFKMATVPSSLISSEQDERTREESLRSFAFALQILALETVEPEDDVGEHLSIIEEIAFKRLFNGKFSKYWVVIETNPDYASRALGQPFFFETKAEAHRAALDMRARIKTEAETYEAKLELQGKKIPEKKRRAHEMRLSGLTVHEEKDHWETRQVEINGEIWEILHLLRDKSLERAIEKMERYCLEGTPFKVVADRGGYKLVVSSIVDAKGKRRPATKDDARFFLDYTRQRLWNVPMGDKWVDHLEEIPDPGPKSSTSHREYWDVKIIGRFYRENDEKKGQILAGRIEQIVTTSREYLSTKTSTGGDNHYIYQSMQLFNYLCPLWWPRLQWGESERRALVAEWKSR